ncbi:MAG: DUF4349 domain-containing protein [Candidatus Paceibacterota bacterium]
MEEEIPLSKKVMRWVKEHKLGSSFILLGSIILILFITSTVLVSLSDLQHTTERPQMYTTDEGTGSSDASSESATKRLTKSSEGDAPDVSDEDIFGIKVIEGSAEIESENAQKDEALAQELVKDHGGYTEESKRSEGRLFIRFDMKIRVPSDDFDDFFSELRDSLEMESFNIRDYRIDLEKRETRLDTLMQTMEMYDEMIEESRQMELGDERLDMTKKLVDQKMDLKRQEDELRHSISRSQRKSKYATLSLSIKENVDPEIIPDDIGERFKNNLHASFKRITDSATSVLGNSLVLITVIAEWMIYGFIIILALVAVVGILKKLYRHIYKRKEE